MTDHIPDHNAEKAEAEFRKRKLIYEAWQRQKRRARRVQLFMATFLLMVMIPAISSAAPIFAFALGAQGLALLSGTALTVVSSILGFATTMGATYLIGQLFYEEPKDPGVKGQLQSGETVPQSFIVGTYATAGSLVYAGSWGESGKTPNQFLVQVIAVGDLPYSDINSRHWIWGKKADLNKSGTVTLKGNNVGYKVSTYDGDMWIKFKDGSQTVEDPYLAALFNSAGIRPLTTDFIGRGRAYIIVTTRYNPDIFDDFPTGLYSFDGIKLYDPRLDSTQVGGSVGGTHRYGTYSTYAFTANNKVIHYNAKRGIFWGNNVEWMFGGQALPAYLLDNSTWFAAMNACDEDIALAGGGTEKRWRMGAEIQVNMDYVDFSETLDKCTNARTMEYGGTYKTYVGGAGAAVYSFTDDDVVATLDQDNRFSPDSNDLFNMITASYPEPDEAWENKPLTRINSTFLTEDNGRRNEQTVQLPYLTKNTRVQRIIKAMINESRRNKTHLLALGPNAFRLESLDPVSFTSVKYQYSNKKFILGAVQPFTDLGYIVVALRETDATDFSWTAGTDEVAVDITPTDDLPPAAQILSVTYSAYSIKNNAGAAKVAAIKGTWTVDTDMVDCQFVRFQVRLLDTADTDLPIHTIPFDEGKFIIAAGILRNETYQVRSMIIPFSDRPVAWGDWVNVTTPNTGSTEVSDTAPAQVTPAPTMALRTKVQRDGSIIQYLLVSWVNLADDKVTYTVRDSDGVDVTYYPGDFPIRVPVKNGESHVIRVQAISRFGVRGPVSDPATGVTMPIPKKGTGSGAVPAVASLTIVGQHRRNVIDWATVDRDTYPDFGYSEVERSNNGTSGWAVVKRLTASGWIDGNLANADGKYYRVTHFDTSGNPGTTSGVINATTTVLAISDVEAGIPADVVGVNTENVNADAIQGYVSIMDQVGDTVTWPTVSSNQRSPASGYRRVGTTNFQNRNPSPVTINVQMMVGAATSPGDANGGKATRTVTVRLHSYPASGSPSDSTVIWARKLTHTAIYGKKSKKPAKALILMTLVDHYDSGAKREYALEIMHQLKVNGPSHNVTSGGGVTGVRIQFIWNKK